MHYKGINGAFDGDADLDRQLESLEEVLIQADIGSSTTNTILSDLRTYAKKADLKEDDILPVLRARLIESLTPPDNGANSTTTQGLLTSLDPTEPTVLFVIGANGVYDLIE